MKDPYIGIIGSPHIATCSTYSGLPSYINFYNDLSPLQPKDLRNWDNETRPSISNFNYFQFIRRL